MNLSNTRIIPGVLGTLLLALLAFTACDDPTQNQEIDITLRSDYSGLADAINGTGQSLSQKLALIETVLQNGFTGGQNALEMIRQTLASLSGSATEKLAAIETAVKSQTVSFETKLALIEAAVSNGLADAAAQRALLQQALEALGGTADERLQAVETALRNGALGLGTKLDLIVSALENGLAGSEDTLALIQQAIASVGSTTEEKLAAIETAVKSQTTSLEAKLAALEAAVASGFADAQAGQALLQEALTALTGTAAEKLAAIETAVSGQTASQEAKLDLIEAAVSGGLADVRACQALIQQVIASLGTDLDGQLASLRAAVTSQTTSLETKLALIGEAVSSGTADSQTGLELIEQAIASLQGTMEEQLAALDTAITRQTVSLDTKLTAIETAVAKGFVGEQEELALIQKAVEAIPGSIEDKLAAFEDALSNPKTGLVTKLAAIAEAIAAGFTPDENKPDLVVTALTNLAGTVEEKLAALDTAILKQTLGLDTKFDAIQGALTTGLDEAKTALQQMKDAVLSLKDCVAGDKGLLKKIDEVVAALGTIDTSLKDNVAQALSEIQFTIAGLKDYGAILATIQQTIEALGNPDPITITFSDEYVKDDEVLMLAGDKLSIPYTVTSQGTVKVTVSPSDDITASVVPDPDKPLEGIIEIKSGNSITEGKTQVVVTAANKSNADKHTLTLKEAYLTPVSSPVDSIPISFTDNTLEIQYKTNLDCAAPAIPDSAKNLVKVLKTEVASDITTLTISISPNDGDRPRLMGVTIKETRFNKDSLMFTFWQQCDDREIKFEDDGLRRKIVRSGLDVNGDGKISRAEARAAKSLTTILGAELTDGADYESFNEFWYFTGIDTIPEGSFRNWKRLKQITLPESITTIMGGYGDADGPFVDCPSLTSISGRYATADSTALIYERKLLKVVESFEHNNYTKPYEIPEGVKVIGSKAFYKSRLENVKFPESLTTIRDRAFEYSRIDSVVFPKNIQGAAYVDSIAENSFIHCFCLKGFDGPMTEGSVRVTPDYLGLYRDTTFYAFALGADAITYVIPGDLGIKKLAASVFSVMEKNDKGEDVVNSDVELLLYLGLPSTITHIREHAFSGQTRSLQIYFAGENPPRFDVDVFDYAKDVTIQVPAGADDTENSARIASFEEAIDQKDLHRIKEIRVYSQWYF